MSGIDAVGSKIDVSGNITDALKSQIMEFINQNSKDISAENKEALMNSIKNFLKGRGKDEIKSILKGNAIKEFVLNSTKMGAQFGAIFSGVIASKILAAAIKMKTGEVAAYMSSIMSAFKGLMPAEIITLNKSGTLEKLLNKDIPNSLSQIKLQLLFKMAATMSAAQIGTVIKEMSIKDKISDASASKLLEMILIGGAIGGIQEAVKKVFGEKIFIMDGVRILPQPVPKPFSGEIEITETNK